MGESNDNTAREVRPSEMADRIDRGKVEDLNPLAELVINREKEQQLDAAEKRKHETVSKYVDHVIRIIVTLFVLTVIACALYGTRGVIFDKTATADAQKFVTSIWTAVITAGVAYVFVKK